MIKQRSLTELEGAILTSIALSGNDTAYKVRRGFQQSPSSYWRGSAGAVSPAIRRLVSLGFISTRPHRTRRGLRLKVTDEGLRLLQAWAVDADLACGFGYDPFRLRSGLWRQLSPELRRQALRAMEERLLAELTDLADRPLIDPVHVAQAELAVALQKGRLEWVRRQLSISGATAQDPASPG